MKFKKITKNENETIQILLININEPCYFDFLYEEIRTQTEAEIINTILFESTIRTEEIKKTLEDDTKSEELLSNITNSPSKNTQLSNPIYNTVNEFSNSVNRFFSLLHDLKLDNEKTISEEEFIEDFFKGDVHKYKVVLDTLNDIDNTLKNKLLPNIFLNVTINNSNNYPKKDFINPFATFHKYGLDYNNYIQYINEYKQYLESQNSLKNKLINNDISLTELTDYQQKINKLIREYRRFIYTKIHTTNKTIIYIGKRPISTFLNILEIQIPYSTKNSSKNRIKNTLHLIEQKIADIKDDTKRYNLFKNNDSLKILAMKPEMFSKILFIYDWIEYTKIDNNHTYYNASQKEKIEYLQSIYPHLKNVTFKTLENELNTFRRFIKLISSQAKKTKAN